MLSKAVGKTLGVARKATVIVVRYVDKFGQRSNPHGIDALLQTYDDIKSRHHSSKVVVELSSSLSGNKVWIKEIATEIMQDFAAMKNVLFVMAAGNGKPVSFINFTIACGHELITRIVNPHHGISTGVGCYDS